MLKTRTMARKDWKVIQDRTYSIKPLTIQGKTGKISRLFMNQVSEPFWVESLGIKKKIVDQGYTWIQLALDGGFWWMTAMFDETGAFKEVYMDLTDGNRTGPEDPEFEDLYLDYVLFPDRVVELDRDELEEAFQKQLITRAQYERTLEVGEKVKKELLENGKKLMAFFEQAYRDI